MRSWVMLVLMVGCQGGKGTELVIVDEPLSGTIAGADWVFATGEIDVYLSEGDELFAVLYPDVYEPCSLEGSTSDHLNVVIPATVGEHPFTTTRNGSFTYEGADGPENLATLDGVVRVDSVGDTELSGGLAMTDGTADFDVSGTFTLTLCDQ